MRLSLYCNGSLRVYCPICFPLSEHPYKACKENLEKYKVKSVTQKESAGIIDFLDIHADIIKTVFINWDTFIKLREKWGVTVETWEWE